MRLRTAIAITVLGVGTLAASPVDAVTRTVVNTRPSGVTDTNPSACIIDWQTGGRTQPTRYYRYYVPTWQNPFC